MDHNLARLIEMFEDKEIGALKKILEIEAYGNLDLAVELVLTKPTNKNLKDKKLKQLTIHDIFTSNSKTAERQDNEIENPRKQLHQPLKINEGQDKEASDILNQINSSEAWFGLLGKRKADEAKGLVELKKKHTGESSRKPIFIYDNDRLYSLIPSCTLHLKVLPSTLALDLFNEILIDENVFDVYKMVMFERQVESLHKTRSYSSELMGFPGGDFYFCGKISESSKPFSPVLTKVAELVGEVVNAELLKRERHRLDLGPEDRWVPNYAACNLYETSKNNVGWHTDRLTYLGPRPIIASLSLGVTRQFRLRKVTPDSDHQVYSAILPHNSLFIMFAPTQENYKHCVPPQPTLTPFPDENTKRINLTFRYYPSNFGPKHTPLCHCSIPADLRVSNLDPKTIGKYFLKCTAPEASIEGGCGFFKFIEFPDNPSSNHTLFDFASLLN